MMRIITILSTAFLTRGTIFLFITLVTITGGFETNGLDEYNGLVYSVKDEGGYCKFCVSPEIRCTCGAATK